jgi:Domain of unknown function (DUF4037)
VRDRRPIGRLGSVADPSFVPGLELSRRFHDEVVRPILDAGFPGLRYSAGRLDSGSELLGFDTVRSTDHDWGPRLQLFLATGDLSRAGSVHAALRAGLPDTFLGYPTRFAGDPNAELGVGAADGERHGVFITSPNHWFGWRLGFDPRRGVHVVDWLSLPSQRLAEVTGGAVFHDGLDGVLGRVRAALAWYPADVWRYVLACQWARIGQEEHLMGRAGEAGDELGSAVLAGRLVRDVMRLCLTGALAATSWRQRETHLSRAYEAAGALCNATGLSRPVDPATRAFHGRPFRVLDAGRFARTLNAAIGDPWLRQLPQIGAVDQYVDNTDALGDMARCRALTEAWLAASAARRPNDR